MRRLRSLTAWLLLTLWLPAMLHCDMEAAGIAGMLGCHDHEVSGIPHRSDDPCHTFEGSTYRLDSAVLKAPLPLVVEIGPAAELTIAIVPPPAREVAEVGQAPPELARTWQFVRRAAPAPRAPAIAS